MEKPVVFLSHSSADKESLAELKKLLDKRAAGSLEFFLSSDGQSIRFGRNWVTRISDALSKAKLMFVFLSLKSADSKWIHFESGCAYSNNIQVVPVCLPGMDLNRVSPPLNLLQGFNLHSFEAISNLARICNEEFTLRMDEVFTKHDFEAVFGNVVKEERGFFGQNAFLIDHVSFYFKSEIPRTDSFKALQQLEEVCKEAKRKPLSETGSHGQDNYWTRFELPGCVMNVDEHPFVKDAEKRVIEKLIRINCELSPELFHLNAPLLDKWYAIEQFKPWSTTIYFRPEVAIESVRHRLTTKLYESGISVIEKSQFMFEGLIFSFSALVLSRLSSGLMPLSFECSGKLSDARLPRLIDLLVELGVIFEREPVTYETESIT